MQIRLQKISINNKFEENIGRTLVRISIKLPNMWVGVKLNIEKLTVPMVLVELLCLSL